MVPCFPLPAMHLPCQGNGTAHPLHSQEKVLGASSIGEIHGVGPHGLESKEDPAMCPQKHLPMPL